MKRMIWSIIYLRYWVDKHLRRAHCLGSIAYAPHVPNRRTSSFVVSMRGERSSTRGWSSVCKFSKPDMESAKSGRWVRRSLSWALLLKCSKLAQIEKESTRLDQIFSSAAATKRGYAKVKETRFHWTWRHPTQKCILHYTWQFEFKERCQNPICRQ